MDISGIFNRPRAQSVNDAIQGAATATGASFDYLLATAQAESGLNPQAASPTSSARGLYQFIDQTWLATLKRAGPALGYGNYADAIVQNAAGRYEVPDPATRRDVMALRYDPAANAAMAGALTRDNAAALAGGLGRKPSDGELYIAHVLGPSGAVKLTGLAVTNPSAPADAAFPAAAEANRSIFYNQQGRPRSVADVYGVLVGRYDGAHRPVGAAFAPSVDVPSVGARGNVTPQAPIATAAAATGAPLVIVPGVPFTAPVPARDTAAAAAPVESAEQKSQPVFNGLFSDRSEPISQVVQNLWTPRTQPSPSSPAPSSAASLVTASGSRELFLPQANDPAGLFGR
jgi:hypothetical protein